MRGRWGTLGQLVLEGLGTEAAEGGGRREGSQRSVPAKRRRMHSAWMEPSRNRAANACRVVA